MKTKSNYLVSCLTLVVLAIVSCNMISCSDDDDTSGDIVNPYVVSYNPVSGVNGVDLSSNLVITFDDIVYKGSGNITINSSIEGQTQVIDVNSDRVTITNVGRVLTINPSDFLSGQTYTVVLDAGIVVDAAGNEYFGTDGESWTFTTGGNPGDLDAPEVALLIPADDETAAGVISLALQFNEDVKVGTGTFDIYMAGGTLVAQIDVESDYVIIDGNIVTINLPETLDFGTSYYVMFATGVIKDMAGNNFEGFDDNTSWSFTTTTGSTSDLVVHLPMDTDLNDDSGNLFNGFLGATATVDYEFVTDGDRGQVVHFPSGSFATLPKHDLLRPSGSQSFSVNFWVKMPTAIGSDPALLGNSNWAGGSNQGWVLAIDGANAYDPSDAANTEDGWTINLANGAERTDWEAGRADVKAPNLADGNWHMVTMVIDRSTEALKVYTDGVEYVHADGSDLNGLLGGALVDETNDYPVNLWEDGSGVYNSGSTTRSQLDGYMDEVSYYNKALTVDEINVLLTN